MASSGVEETAAYHELRVLEAHREIDAGIGFLDNWETRIRTLRVLRKIRKSKSDLIVPRLVESPELGGE